MLKKSEKSTYLNLSFETDKYLHFYEGYLADQPTSSHIKGILVNGSFFGAIDSNHYGKFIIEPPGRYAKNTTTPDFDAVIYHEEALNEKRYSKRSPDNLSRILDSLEISDTRSVWTSPDTEHLSVTCASANATIDLLMSNELNRTDIEVIPIKLTTFNHPIM